MPLPPIEFRDGVYHLSGRLDEKFNLDSVLDDRTYPIRLNLRHIATMSSAGIAKLMALMRAVGEENFEFHECPAHFIATINLLPRLRSHPESVKSCYFPHACDPCKSSVDVLIRLQEVRYKGGKISMPRKFCEVCKAQLRHDVALNDFFVFLIEPPAPATRA